MGEEKWKLQSTEGASRDKGGKNKKLKYDRDRTQKHQFFWCFLGIESFYRVGNRGC